MKKLFLTAVLLAPTLLFAQGAFDGTWRFNPQKAEFKGDDTLSLKDGVYRCDTCVPKIDVKADGQDHKVEGSPYFDTTNVRVVDDNTLEMVNKKGGKVNGTTKRTVSPDAKKLTDEFSFVTDAGQKGNGKFNSTRVGDVPAGAHKISGVWHPEKMENISENVMTVTYKASDDGLSMTSPMGSSYTAKFDGKDYPYKGDPGTTSVSLKKVDANTIEETDKRDGKVISVARMTVAPDGKSITLMGEDKLTGNTSTWTADKQ